MIKNIIGFFKKNQISWKDSILHSTKVNAVPLQDKIKDYYLKHGYMWDEVNLIGVRNSAARGTNRFDDLFCVVSDSRLDVYKCTTDPGTTWDEEKKKKYGITYDGTVCLGHYKKAYRFGKHRGYEALVQNAPFNDYRDLNKNGLLDSSEKVNKNVLGGYNIHTVGNPEKDGGKVSREIVDVASAGCQVFASQADFLNFLASLKKTQKYKKNKQTLFDYLLVESKEFEFYEDLKNLM